MSLKAFHIFFIGVSILLTLGFGVWGIYAFRENQDSTYLALSLFSLFLSVVLVLYGFMFWQKLKKVR